MVDDDAHWPAGTAGKRGLDVEVAPDHFLVSLIHGVLQAFASSDEDVITVLAVLGCG